MTPERLAELLKTTPGNDSPWAHTSFLETLRRKLCLTILAEPLQDASENAFVETMIDELSKRN